MMTQTEFEKWYQKNEQSGCRLARLDKVAACNLCYTIGFLQSEYQDNKALQQIGKIVANQEDMPPEFNQAVDKMLDDEIANGWTKSLYGLIANQE